MSLPGRRRAKTALRGEILAVALALALIGVLGTAGCARVLSAAMPSGVIQPRIVPPSTEQGSLGVTREFAFENRTIRLSVPVDRAVYAGATSAQKSAIFFGDSKPGDWVPDYYRAFVNEEHQDAFYAAMLKTLREVRQRDGLDASRYAELITSMVQSLEYRTDPGSLAPKFPVETFADGYGDCDDKTLLAAGLLSRDGYDVAILLFRPEKHVALGIRAPGVDYKNTGYAYVELTEPSLIGVPAEKLAGGIALTSQPTVIKIGEGTGAFLAGDQIDYIQRRLREVDSAAKRLQNEIASKTTQHTSRRASLDQARQALSTTSDPNALAVAVPRYNEQVQAYNALTTELNGLISRYNALVDVQRYVADHQTARPQVYEQLRSARF